jgi:DNA-binding NtrC family response regulator
MNVLVVEDEEGIRVLAESILEDAGHTVFSASGETSAKAILESDQAIDILFTDVSLSNGEEGLQLAQAAIKHRPNLRVIYTTGRGVSDGVRAAFVEPFQFVAKPYTAQQLLTAVDEAFSDEATVRPKTGQ